MSAPGQDKRIPGYWRDEISGVLAPVIEAYLFDRPMTLQQIGIMRAYLRQWIMAPVWRGDEELAALRESVEEITTQQDIRDWLYRALDEGHDPL